MSINYPLFADSYHKRNGTPADADMADLGAMNDQQVADRYNFEQDCWIVVSFAEVAAPGLVSMDTKLAVIDKLAADDASEHQEAAQRVQRIYNGLWKETPIDFRVEAERTTLDSALAAMVTAGAMTQAIKDETMAVGQIKGTWALEDRFMSGNVRQVTERHVYVLRRDDPSTAQRGS